MEPNFKDGENFLASGIFYILRAPKEGDRVIVKKQNQYLFKRIIRIENGKYFVAGDNNKDSLDSRKFGWISRKQILAKYFYKL